MPQAGRRVSQALSFQSTPDFYDMQAAEQHADSPGTDAQHVSAQRHPEDSVASVIAADQARLDVRAAHEPCQKTERKKGAGNRSELASCFLRNVRTNLVLQAQHSEVDREEHKQHI